MYPWRAGYDVIGRMKALEKLQECKHNDPDVILWDYL